MPRPTKYSPELIEEICERLSKGEPLEQICRDDDRMPATRTIRDWIEGKTESVPSSVSADIAHARDIGFDVIANNTRLVARGLSDSTGDVQRDKLIVETDLKLLAKWNPRKYGDRITQQHEGNPEKPIQIKAEQELLALSAEEILAINEILNSKPDDSEDDE